MEIETVHVAKSDSTCCSRRNIRAEEIKDKSHSFKKFENLKAFKRGSFKNIFKTSDS